MKKLVFIPLFLLLLTSCAGGGGNANFGDWVGYYKGVHAYEDGDYAMALREWTPLAEQGFAEAQADLAFLYAHGHGVTQDYKVAAKWNRLSAEQGYAKAQYNMGHIYFNGLGVPQNYMSAYIWTSIAASNGDEQSNKVRDLLKKELTSAQISAAQALVAECASRNYKGCLSIVSSFGQDFNKGIAAAKSGDYATAVREFTPLAEQGDVKAQYNLGLMYENGKGTAQDYEAAAKWYKLAAKQGNADAQLNLGSLYLRGDGVPQNYKSAVKWNKLAAEQGHAKAQNNLGTSYFYGHGVPQDYIYAYMWGDIAASNGNKKGSALRDSVADKMIPADISAAKALAVECIDKTYKGC